MIEDWLLIWVEYALNFVTFYAYNSVFLLCLFNKTPLICIASTKLRFIMATNLREALALSQPRCLSYRNHLCDTTL